MKQWLIEVRFESPEYDVCPGQILALYDNDECLGGGPILAPGKSQFEKLVDVSFQLLDGNR